MSLDPVDKLADATAIGLAFVLYIAIGVLFGLASGAVEGGRRGFWYWHVEFRRGVDQ